MDTTEVECIENKGTLAMLLIESSNISWDLSRLSLDKDFYRHCAKFVVNSKH